MNNNILDFFISLYNTELYPENSILMPAIPVQKIILIEYRPYASSTLRIHHTEINNYSIDEINLIAKNIGKTLLDIDIDIDNAIADGIVIGRENGYFNYKSKLINYNILATKNSHDGIDINISFSS